VEAVAATLDSAVLPGGQCVVSACGILDHRLAPSMLDLLVELTGSGEAVILDLDGAHHLDDHALAVIGVAARVAAVGGQPLALVSGSPFVRNRLITSGLIDLTTLSHSLSEAIAHA
jgi:anti-anti-sigma regulatory factor